MVRKVVLALVLSAAMLVWLAPDVRAAAVGSRFDVTLYGSLRLHNIWRDGVAQGDTDSPSFAVPRELFGTSFGVRANPATGVIETTVSCRGIDKNPTITVPLDANEAVRLAACPRSTKKDVWKFHVGSTRFGFRIKGPDVKLLGTAKSSALIEIDGGLDPRAFGSNNSSNPAMRMRHAMFDLDWEGKTVDTKLRIGQFFNFGNGISFMSVQSTSFFGGSLSSPYVPQIAFWHNWKINKDNTFLIQYAATWRTTGVVGQWRDPNSEATAPGGDVALTWTSRLYGKKPVMIKTDFMWARTERQNGPGGDSSGNAFVADRYIWTNAFVIPLIWNVSANAEFSFHQGGQSGNDPLSLGVIIPSSRNRLEGNIAAARQWKPMVIRGSAWWAGLTWEATKALTFNGAVGQERRAPSTVPFAFGNPISIADSFDFFQKQTETAFNVWYNLTENTIIGVEYRKRIASYRDKADRKNPNNPLGCAFTPDGSTAAGCPTGMRDTVNVKDGSVDSIEVLFRYDF